MIPVSPLPSANSSYEYAEQNVFDAAKDCPRAIRKAFVDEGFIVVNNVSTPEARQNAVDFLHRKIEVCPEASIQGFFEAYHDDTLAQLRQNPELVQTFATVWGCKELWVDFDRLIYMNEANSDSVLPLHVDQNPHSQPDFSATQGLLALKECDESTGMLGVIPRSQHRFHEYRAWSDDRQGWVEYKGEDASSRRDDLRAVPLKAGEMVIWDSRLTHSRCNPVPTDGKSRERILAMISFAPACRNEALRERRVSAFESGTGVYNHEAGLRKTAHSHVRSLRESAENLTELGNKIYGITPWWTPANDGETPMH